MMQWRWIGGSEDVIGLLLVILVVAVPVVASIVSVKKTMATRRIVGLTKIQWFAGLRSGKFDESERNRSARKWKLRKDVGDIKFVGLLFLVALGSIDFDISGYCFWRKGLSCVVCAEMFYDLGVRKSACHF